MIRMKHEQHGFHWASSLEEAEMRKNGWVDDANEPEIEVIAIVGEEVAQVAPLKRPYNRKANK